MLPFLEICSRLTRIEALLGALTQKGSPLMALLDDMIAKITLLTDADAGMEAALDALIVQDTELSNQLKAALGSSNPAQLQAVILQLDANIAEREAKKQAILDAIAANVVPVP